VGATRKGSGQKGEEFLEATSGVLVKIGVPGGYERNAYGVGEQRAELAEFARAGDVNNIGFELLERAANGLEVPPEKKIVTQVALDTEAGEAAGKFDTADTVLFELEAFRTWANAKEGKPATLGKSNQLASG
jgi:hypothetical protein